MADTAASSSVAPLTLRPAWSARWARARWPLPAAAAVGAASCLLLVLQAPALLQALYRNADNAATLLLAQLRPAGSVTQIGDHPFYEAWWFMRSTLWLPDHILLWQLAPFAVAFLGIAGIALCAAAVSGRAGFVVAAAGAVAMSPPLRAVLLVPPARVGLVLHAAVLCGGLLAVDRQLRRGRMSRGRWLAAAVVLGGFTAAGSTDKLLIPAAVAPFALAGLCVWWCERTAASRALAAFSTAVALGSVALAALITQAMDAERVIVHPFAVRINGLADLRAGMGVTVHLFAILTGGGWTPAGVLGVLALVASTAALVRGVWRLKPHALADRERTRLLYLAFWGSALILSFGAVAFTSTSLDGGVYDGAQRYLLGSWAALLALLAAAATTRPRANALLAGVCVFGALNLALNVSSLQQPWEYAPDAGTRRAIESFVLAHGATVGYGDYWDVMPIGLDGVGRLRVVPIIARSLSGPWAGHFVAADSAWFRPQPGVRASFLLADARDIPYASDAPPPSFGTPVASAHFGPLTVYVYGHDVARDLAGTVS